MREQVASIMEAHWEPDWGYCVPNRVVYPLQWLWDSCFHAIVWASLGDERALVELQTVFHSQAPDGFVPHMGYQRDPADSFEGLWGHRGSSVITQPPMHAHTALELRARGFEPGTEIVERIGLALDCLWKERRAPCGLLSVYHPWETGLDDTPRWDDWCEAGWERGAWYERKIDLIASLERSPATGMAVGNPLFDVCAASFNALYAFNCAEYAALAGDHTYESRATEVVELLDATWDEPLATWVDLLPDGSSRGSLSARTLDAVLPILTTVAPARVDRVFQAITSHDEFGGRYGPVTVHRKERAFNPTGYWRGSTWAQINYLLWVAARRHGRHDVADQLARQTADGATRSGFAEYWHPDTAEGHGAIPQTWTCLAYVMSP